MRLEKPKSRVPVRASSTDTSEMSLSKIELETRR